MSASARRIRQLLSWLGDRDRQLQLALDAADLGVWNWDPSTNELAWSDRCRTLIGVSADEPPKVETFLKLVHEEDRAAVERAIESALRNGDSYSIEYRIVMPGGEVRWLHSLGRVHQTDLRSSSFGMSGIIRDVTLAHRVTESAQRQEQYLEQLRRQDAQQRIDQRYRLLVESLPLGIMLADVDGRITYVNAAWGALATNAANNGNAIGLDQMSLVHAQDRVRVLPAWRALLQQSPAALEFRLHSTDAEPRWVHCLSTALRDANGMLLGFAHAAVDVSSQRQQRAATELRHDQVLALAHRLQRLRESERLDLAGLLQREIVRALGRLQDGLVAVDAADTLNDARAAAAEIVPLIGATTEQLRRILHELNPPGIEELGFAGALERILGDQAERAGFEYELSMPETPMLAQPRILQALYGVAQEAIGNISRHAAATRVHVSLIIEPGSARLQVRDNGVGMREDAWHRPHCHGLHAAKARLAEFGGSLQAAGTPGQGTLLEAVVPLPQI
jgi:PAS domain S-box-containing protein